MNRIKNWQLIVTAIALLLLAVAPAAYAQQQTGNVYGTVTDTGGDSLPGVRVTLTGIGAPRVTFTDGEGQFRFLNLSPGNYQLVSELEGFSTVEYENVNVRVGRNTTFNIELNAAVEDVITVTSESPLLDERKLDKGTTVSQIELEKIPTARDPWAIVTQTPGVQSDRINVGGDQSGQQAVFTAPGVSDDENSFAVDGVVITDMAAIGASPTYYDFDQFEEIQISTGGSDITKISAGAALNLVTKRGSNTPRGSARFLLTDSSEQFGIFEQADTDVSGDLAPGQAPTTGNQINEVLDYGFEAGGPIMRDRLWIWGSYGRNDIKMFAAGGTPDNTLLENSAVKLNFQPTTNNSGVFAWNRGDKLKFGRNASLTRPGPTTFDQDGPTEIWKIEDTHVFSSDFYLTGLFSYVDGGFQLQSKGGHFPSPTTTDADVALAQGENLWDENGVWQNGFYSGISDRNTDTYQVDGSYFFNTGTLNHELKFGVHYRTFESESNFGWPGGRNLGSWSCEPIGTCGIAGSTGVVVATRTGVPPIEQTYTSAWLQDTLTFSDLTVNFGLRYDLQEGENLAGGATANPVFPDVLPALDFAGNDPGFEWSTISPRLGLTYALGEERRTLLRGSYARFAEQLETTDISPINPVGNAFAYFWWTDSDDDNIYDVGEPASLAFTSGFNPADPTSLETLDRIDPGLDAPVTDELVFGVEHALMPEFVIGADVTYRLTSDILENRELLFNGVEFVEATQADYVLDVTDERPNGQVCATLPNGQIGCGELWRVRDGLDASAGASLLTNGDRELEYLGGSLTFTKRLSSNWMARGYVNYGETEWNIPGNFINNPTNDPEVGDKDGELFIVQSAGSGAFDDVYIQSTWSANLNGMYQVAPDAPWGFNVAANLYAREGYPIPFEISETASDGINRDILLTNEVDSFRNDDVFIADLRVEKDIAFGDNMTGTVSIDAFNIFDEQTALQRENDLTGSRGNYLEQTLSPRIYRLGFRVSWR